MREWRERREDRREKRGCMRGEERKGEERRGSLRPRRRALIVNAHGMHCLGVAAQRNILYYIALYYISIILVWYYVMVCYIIIIIIIIIIIMLYIYIYIYARRASHIAFHAGKEQQTLGIHQRGVRFGVGCSGWGQCYIINQYITSYKSLHPVSTAPPFAECRNIRDIHLYLSTNQYSQYPIQNRYTVF